MTARTVTLGQAEGQRVQVTQGLAVGDRVVVDGADRLKEGMQVIPQAPAAPGQPAAPAADGDRPRRRRNGAGGGEGGGARPAAPSGGQN